MNKTYLGIIFAVIMLMSIGAAAAILDVGTWVGNNANSITITNGDSAEFRFGVNAVTIYGGEYSVKLYREGSSTPIFIYANNIPTIDNGALGRFTVTSSNYGNIPGNYYVVIDSYDEFATDTFTIYLQVLPKVVPLTITCSASPTSGLAPLNVAFNAQANGGTGSYSYKWNFGDNTIITNTQNQITHIYSDGKYSATVTVIDSNNVQTTANCVGNIVVTKPITPITGVCNSNPTIGTSPLNVLLNVQASGGSGIYSYQWSFGDTTTGTNLNSISHTYNTANTYNPTVKITDSQNNVATISCGTINVNKPIVQLTATCSANPISGNYPLTTSFNSNVNGGSGTYSYKWTFGDGTSAVSQESSSHTYNVDGTYSSTLTITDSNSNSITANCGQIIVNKPITPIIVSCQATPLSGTSPLNVAFNAQVSGGSGAYTYKWNFGDSSTNTNNVNKILAYTYYNAGTFVTSVTVSDTNNNQATASCGTINVNSQIPPITATCTSTPSSGTSPLNVAFNTYVSGGTGSYTYKWTFGDGTTNNYPSTTTHTYNEGTYNPTVKITDTANNQATISCESITVYKTITPLTAICSASPTSGNTPLNVNFNSQVSGGSGTYSYSWTFGDGATSTNQNTVSHTYSIAGKFNPTLKITDSQNNVINANCVDTNGINVIKPTPILNVDSITCFPRVTDGKNQSCSVFVKSSNGQIAGNVNINIYYSDGTSFGSCITDKLSGGCEVEKIVHGVGTYTVYATANANGFTGDNDKKPTFTYEVFAQRYNIINLATYNDSKFYYPDDTFYRGEPLYAKFQVYDPVNNVFMTNDIVTAAALVSLPGGRADLSRLSYSGNWYYYKLDAIPLTHDFLGGSNVFAFAFNFTGLTSGQAQVSLNILNNKPTISRIADVYVKVGQTYTIPLNNYGTDLEDKILKWQITNTPSKFSATIGASNILSIRGTISGDDSLKLNGYDLDNDYASTIIMVHVLPVVIPNNLTASCNVDLHNGNAPLTVTANGQATGGTGTYTYQYSFGDGSVVSQNQNSFAHKYNIAGVYSVSLTVTDSNNNVISSNCGIVTVNIPYSNLAASCTPSQTDGTIPAPTSGTIPLNIILNSQANGGTGLYTYIWRFGDGQSATTPSSASTKILFTHTYNASGVYNPTLEIIDSANNNVTADCGQITANNVVPTSLDVTCIAMPNNGIVPFNVMFTSVVNKGVGPYTYVYDYGMGYTTTSQNNIAYQTYNTPGSYSPSVHVTDNNGNIGDAICGLIIANSNIIINVTYPVANAGGPYAGFINEPVTFDASASVGNIMNYRWDFGDGTGIIDTTSPTIEHTYTNINIYNVKLTVFDVNGYNVDAQTTATIIEHSNYKNITVKDVPDKGILIQQLSIYGQYGEILKPNDDMNVNIVLKNEWPGKLENVRIIVSIPDLGIETRSELFDLRSNAQYSDTLTLPLYNVKPGTYYVQISVVNDQGDNQVRRIKYREVIVK